MPDELAYLYAWAHELHGRSGFTMSGVAPLSPVVVESWARLKHLVVEPHEYDALVSVDAAMLPLARGKGGKAAADATESDR